MWIKNKNIKTAKLYARAYAVFFVIFAILFSTPGFVNKLLKQLGFVDTTFYD